MTVMIFIFMIILTTQKIRKTDRSYTATIPFGSSAPHHDNIICLPGEPGDVLSPNPRPKRKVVGIMSTYEEFMVLLTTGLLIVAILNLKNKK